MKIDFEPVGTGPFVFTKYVKDQVVRYKSNPKYFKGEPAIKRLLFSITQ
ncbi:MAG: ABC transporter substrate-binding protein, partial [Acidimicrobiia bacterium]